MYHRNSRCAKLIRKLGIAKLPTLSVILRQKRPGLPRSAFLALAMPLFLSLSSGCGSGGMNPNEPDMGAANEPDNRQLHDTEELHRLLTVYLQPDSDTGYQPVYADRIVVAQPVVPLISKRAEGRMLVQGIDTVVIGSSCENLMQSYPEISECTIVDSMEVSYGDIQSSATTDLEGFASLKTGQGDVRVSVRSWPTVEDSKCHWSGSAVVTGTMTSVAIPLLVFCE